uniref:Reverse transcriptase domain-containing protein n=1 Tax=Tanacetum cinerariifolium TaxID=118510 RepID=A0A6L2J9H2_TANCI|nr:reverse transcriptase domain-containing protein [Tanacetum cinerariifolium]
MSAMANTTPLVTTVTKPATNPRDADAAPRVNIKEFCEEYYEDILPIIMDKVRHDRWKDVHTRLDFGEGHRRQSAFDRLNETYSPSTTKSLLRDTDSRDPFRGKSHARGLNTSKEDRPRIGNASRRKDNKSPLSSVSRSDSSDGRYRRSSSKRHKSTDEDDLTRPWMCKEEDPFTPRIRNFESSRRTRMPNNVKTYDETGVPEDHVKIFQAAAEVERWAMPTWCHMFNSTLIGAARVWFDELPPESIESYKDLKAAFLAYFMQQKKYVKDPVEIHNIKQKDGETIKDFMERFKVENGRIKRAPECMRISGFMHGKKLLLLAKRKGTRPGRHWISPKGKTHIKGPTSRVTQGKEGGLTGLPPYKDAERDSCGRSGKIPVATTHGDAGRKKEQQQQVLQKVTQSFKRVEEITFPPLAASSGTEGPLVIEAEMGGHMIHRMYVDGGSSMEILYEHCSNRLWPEIKSPMVPATTSLTCFSGETIWPLGQLRLLVIIGDTNHSTRSWMNFMIVRSFSPYNGIIGRGIRAIQMVPSTVHEMLKFPVEGGIVAISSTEVVIGGTLSDKRPTELCSILKKNLDIFAWQPSDMTGVPRSVAEHRLNIRERYSPVRQKKRGQAPERSKAIQAEVQKLVEARIMREVYYHDWLSNPVMDCYPLLEIEWKVESLCGYPFKCFLDAYKGYHQIQLAEPDEEKTAFHTGQGVYCYTKMPFGLKNAGATY